MSEMLIIVLKVLAIALVAFFLGKKTGLFSLDRGVSIVILLILMALFGTEIYSSFFRSDISLLVIFKSSFLNLTLDLSFFLRIFLGTLLLGLLCSVFGLKLGGRIKTVKDLCALALLIAITVLLGIYSLRFGSAVKISFKFISVFITAAIFGPFWGGAVGAIADIVAFIVNPVGGAFIPQITMVEFLYGFTYGLFFFNLSSWNGFKTMFRVIVCVIMQITILNLWLTTHLLVPIMNMNFDALLVMRAISGVINMAIQLVTISVMTKYISSFRKILK